MPDLNVTPSQVFPSTKAPTQRAIAAAAINAGDVIALDDNKQAVKADANDSTANKPVGVAVCTAASLGQVINYVDKDTDLTLGTSAAPVAGIPYFLSANPGKICTAADLAPGMHSALIGWGKAGNKLVVSINVSGQTV